MPRSWSNSFLLVFLAAALLSGGPSLAFLKLLVWVGLAIVISLYIKPLWVYFALAIGGVIESLIGLAQFITHKSVGLYFLGESVLSPLNPDVAQTFAEGSRLLRAYGTFPHPNILAAFLVLSLVALYYLFSKNNKLPPYHYLIAISIFIVWLGLLLTFSRAGWLAALIVTALFLIYGCQTAVRWRLAIMTAVIIISLVSIFHWVVLPRLTFTDRFVIQERIGDYQRAWQLIKEKPLFGQGLTLKMGERPIHNLYLLVATEIGLVGLLGFLGFIIWNLFRIWDLEFRISAIMLLALLLLGLTDHFLWTLRPGLAMLWLVIGLLWRPKLS